MCTSRLGHALAFSIAPPPTNLSLWAACDRLHVPSFPQAPQQRLLATPRRADKQAEFTICNPKVDAVDHLHVAVAFDHLVALYTCIRPQFFRVYVHPDRSNDGSFRFRVDRKQCHLRAEGHETRCRGMHRRRGLAQVHPARAAMFACVL